MVPAMATIERYMASTVQVLADRARRVLEDGGLIALPTEDLEASRTVAAELTKLDATGL